jgi:excisionase family DNA binding protein
MMQVASGNPVRMMPANAELTPQEAADLLNVSRPHLVRLLEQGDIPHRLVGTDCRVRFFDVVDYRRRLAARRRGALEELVSLSQKMGLY